MRGKIDNYTCALFFFFFLVYPNHVFVGFVYKQKRNRCQFRASTATCRRVGNDIPQKKKKQEINLRNIQIEVRFIF